MKHVNLKEIAAGTYNPNKADEEVVKVVNVSGYETQPTTQPKASPEAVPIDPESLVSGGPAIYRNTFTSTIGGGTVLRLYFGILSAAADAAGLGLAATLPAPANGNAAVAGKFGAGNPGHVTFVERARRINYIVDSITIITAQTAAGIAQRNNTIDVRTVNADAQVCEFRGSIPIIWDQLTGRIENVLLPISDTVGFTFDLNDAAGAVTIELRLAARGIKSMV